MKPYFHGRVDEAVHKFGTFSIGDKVKVLSSRHPRYPHRFGEIIRLVHGNSGKGRIYAVIALEDGREVTEPLGRCRKQ